MRFPRLRRAVIALGARTLGACLQIYARTLRISIDGTQALEHQLAAGPVIYAFFHSRILLMPFAVPRGRPFRPVAALISASEDGTLIARAVESLGVHAARGSSSRQGARARAELLSELGTGVNVAVTPDGPRGPALQVKPGLVWLAMQSGAPVVAMSYRASRALRARSWDRFVVPLPGARVHIAIAAPMQLDLGASFETNLARVQAYLVDWHARTDPDDPALDRHPA